jgi:hypothetical protein
MKTVKIPIKVGSTSGIISLIKLFQCDVKDEDLLKMTQDELYDLYIKLRMK